MKAKWPNEGKITGSLLAASPELADPNFRQTIIYIAEHDVDGALGVVMNRPTGKTLGDIAKTATVPDRLLEVPVYIGGPVRPKSLLFGIFEEIGLTCCLNASVEEVEKAACSENKWVRAFLGYAGWGEGQLEGELAHDAWTVCRPDPILFDERMVKGLWNVFTSDDDRWRDLLPFLPKDPEGN
ncbi:MAG: YqgE/AlgH family protein [Verrucomicrobia bacterium]|nr:YqgE/AlgH family protein [Verrucomicrobiota bacterium]